MKQRTESGLVATMVPLDQLTPHPRNYRSHPDDQIDHLMASLREYGWYRNVVVARGDVILAGHGIVGAARALGMAEAPIVRLDLDPMEPRALKLLAADNFVSHLAEDDDRALTEMLREIADIDEIGLLGTGFDELSLAALTMVTRPASEIADFDAAAEWVGMPEFEAMGAGPRIVVEFDDPAARQRWADTCGLFFTYRKPGPRGLWSARLVASEAEAAREDRSSVMFEG